LGCSAAGSFSAVSNICFVSFSVVIFCFPGIYIYLHYQRT
jgi:hypothetical protein